MFTTTLGHEGSKRQPKNPTTTLGGSLSSSDNALNFVRLVLAILVIFGHAIPLGGFQPLSIGPFTHNGLHGLAVKGFFAISGYLILASGLRTTGVAYAWRRFLRIYPGYLVAILATAFLLAPLGAVLENGASWSARSAVSYTLGALDLKPSQGEIGQTLLHVPWSDSWNGSLWTLFYEAVAYVLVGLIVSIPLVRKRLNVLVPVASVLLTLTVSSSGSGILRNAIPGVVGEVVSSGLSLWTCFTWGMLAYVLREQIYAGRLLILSAWLVALAAEHLPGTGILGNAVELLSYPALAFAALATGATLPTRLGQKNDLSYGVYVYAFPVQQILVIMGVHHYGRLSTALACLVCTIPFAAASWYFVEKPAMSLKRLIRSGHPEPSSAPQQRRAQ